MKIHIVFGSILLLIGAKGGDINPDNHSVPDQDIWLHEKVSEIPGLKLGPFVRLKGGEIVTVEDTQSFVSKDEGDTWESYEIFKTKDEFLIRPERALIHTKDGTLILAFANDKERANWDWQEDIHDSPGAVLPTYAIRSLDGGKTWQDPQKLHNEWTGAIRDIIQTDQGNIIFTSMMMQHNPGHHSVVTYTSKNEGETWTRSNIIDLGGIGHHSGVTEATIEQMTDGRIWMLMRTMWGRFWEAYSEDEGLTWRDFNATDIEASTAPGLVKRLASGRLILIWNQIYPEGESEYPFRGGKGQWSEVPASNHRKELSIMFSDDDGLTWSPPVVIARAEDRLSYPYMFEARPGELWITTWQGGLRVKLLEKDFI
jgi:hypothetical protein